MNPLEQLGRALGATFDHYITPGILGMALAIVSIGIIR